MDFNIDISYKELLEIRKQKKEPSKEREGSTRISRGEYTFDYRNDTRDDLSIIPNE